MSAKNTKVNFKKGAASFYIVAFSTLILVIIAASFAAIIISEIARTSNDDLSQSAYDSALAGVEDAKLAFYNYQKCQESEKDSYPLDKSIPESDDKTTCKAIKWYVENTYTDYKKCDMVANILGRGDEGEVLVKEEKSEDSDMQQAYTCVKMETDLSDYEATLTNSEPVKVVPAKFTDAKAKDIKKVKISWFSQKNAMAAGMMDGEALNLKYLTLNGEDGIFNKGDMKNMVPVIALGMVQTATKFKLSDFDVTKNDETNRGMIYLVPSGVEVESVEGKYEGVKKNSIGAEAFLKSNDKTTENLPYVVQCNEESNFMCSAEIDLPEPIGGDRNDDTFMFIVSLPYGIGTDFSLGFYYSEEGKDQVATLNNVQVKIDSTGRANDLYRRVEVRLEPESAVDPYAFYGIQLWGNDEESNLMKNLAPTSEWNFKQ